MTEVARNITQFGTSRFLQGHADLFVHQAREAGQNIGPITVVKTTTAGTRDDRVAAFNDGHGFPIRLRGYDGDKLVDDIVMVESVTAALDANHNWEAVAELFTRRTDIVFSNVGDSGFDFTEGDMRLPPSGSVPRSFPAKFLALLMRRFASGARPILVLPCELISDNGVVFRRCLLELSMAWNLPSQFLDWLTQGVTICNTLVDRIVSEAIEPVGAIAEPYGLWAIQWDGNSEFPFQHPKIILTKELESFARLKLHILNLGHTFLADIWKSEDRAYDETVRQILQDGAIRNRLLNLYASEIVPGFGAHDMAERAADYVATTLHRFDNPFLNHRISDIHQNHALKVERRMRAFIDWTLQAGYSAKASQLARICSKYRK